MWLFIIVIGLGTLYNFKGKCIISLDPYNIARMSKPVENFCKSLFSQTDDMPGSEI